MNQDKKTMKNASVSLGEATWRLAEQWKAILLFAVIFALVFLAGMKVWNTKKAKEAKQSVPTEAFDPKTFIESLPEGDRDVVSTAYQLTADKRRASEYIRTAPFMQMDAYHAKWLRVSWMFNVDEVNANSLRNAFYVKLLSDESLQQLRKCYKGEIDAAQLRELILMDYYGQTDANVLTVSILLPEEMDSALLDDTLVKLQEKFVKELGLTGGKQAVQKIEDNVLQGRNEVLIQKQAGSYGTYYNSNAQLSGLMNAFTEQQLAAYNRLLSNGAVPVDNSAQYRPTLTLKNILLGLVLGVILYVLVYYIYALFSNRVHDAKAMKASGIYSLGEWYDNGQSRRAEGLFNSKAVFNRHHCKHLDRTEEADSIVDAVANSCRQKNSSNLLIVALGVLREGHQAFLDEIVEETKKAGLELQVQAYEDTVQFDHALIEADSIIPVVVSGKTASKSIDSMIEKSGHYDKDVLGYIYLG